MSGSSARSGGDASSVFRTRPGRSPAPAPREDHVCDNDNNNNNNNNNDNDDENSPQKILLSLRTPTTSFEERDGGFRSVAAAPVWTRNVQIVVNGDATNGRPPSRASSNGGAARPSSRASDHGQQRGGAPPPPTASRQPSHRRREELHPPPPPQPQQQEQEQEQEQEQAPPQAPSSPEAPPQIKQSHHKKRTSDPLTFEPKRSPQRSDGGMGSGDITPKPRSPQEEPSPSPSPSPAAAASSGLPIETAPSFNLFNQSFDSLGEAAHYLNLQTGSGVGDPTFSFGLGLANSKDEGAVAGEGGVSRAPSYLVGGPVHSFLGSTQPFPMGRSGSSSAGVGALTGSPRQSSSEEEEEEGGAGGDRGLDKGAGNDGDGDGKGRSKKGGNTLMLNMSPVGSFGNEGERGGGGDPSSSSSPPIPSPPERQQHEQEDRRRRRQERSTPENPHNPHRTRSRGLTPPKPVTMVLGGDDRVEVPQPRPRPRPAPTLSSPVPPAPETAEDQSPAAKSSSRRGGRGAVQREQERDRDRERGRDRDRDTDPQREPRESSAGRKSHERSGGERDETSAPAAKPSSSASSSSRTESSSSAKAAAKADRASPSSPAGPTVSSDQQDTDGPDFYVALRRNRKAFDDCLFLLPGLRNTSKSGGGSSMTSSRTTSPRPSSRIGSGADSSEQQGPPKSTSSTVSNSPDRVMSGGGKSASEKEEGGGTEASSSSKKSEPEKVTSTHGEKEGIPSPSKHPGRPSDSEIACRRIKSAICAFGGCGTGNTHSLRRPPSSSSSSARNHKSRRPQVEASKSIFRIKSSDSSSRSSQEAPPSPRTREVLEYERRLPDRYYENDNRLSWEFEECPPVVEPAVSAADMAEDDDKSARSGASSTMGSSSNRYPVTPNKRPASSMSNGYGRDGVGPPDAKRSRASPRSEFDRDAPAGGIANPNEKYPATPSNRSRQGGGFPATPGSAATTPGSTDSGSSSGGKMRYRCKLCGKPKQNHTCPYQQSLQRSIGTMSYPAVNAFAAHEPGSLAPALADMNNFVSRGGGSSGGGSIDGGGGGMGVSSTPGSTDSSPCRPSPDRSLAGGLARGPPPGVPGPPRHYPPGPPPPSVGSTPGHLRGPPHVTPDALRTGMPPGGPLPPPRTPGGPPPVGPDGTPHRTPYRRPGSVVGGAVPVSAQASGGAPGSSTRRSPYRTPGSVPGSVPGSGMTRRKFLSPYALPGCGSDDASSSTSKTAAADSSDLLFVDSIDLRQEQFRLVTPRGGRKSSSLSFSRVGTAGVPEGARADAAPSFSAPSSALASQEKEMSTSTSTSTDKPDDDGKHSYRYPPLPLPYAQRKRLSDNLFTLSKEVPKLTDECAMVLREARERDMWDCAVAELMTQVVVAVYCPRGDDRLEGLRRYLLSLGIAC